MKRLLFLPLLVVSGFCDLVIKEVMFDPSKVSDSVGEYFVLYNSGYEDINLEGFSVRDDSSSHYVITQEKGSTILKPQGSITFCRSADSGSNGGILNAHQLDNFTLSNSTDEIIVLDNSGNEIASLRYDNDWGEGKSAGKSFLHSNPDSVINGYHVPSDYFKSTETYGDGDYGTPNEGIGEEVKEEITIVADAPVIVPDSSSLSALEIKVDNMTAILIAINEKLKGEITYSGNTYSLDTVKADIEFQKKGYYDLMKHCEEMLIEVNGISENLEFRSNIDIDFDIYPTTEWAVNVARKNSIHKLIGTEEAKKINLSPLIKVPAPKGLTTAEKMGKIMKVSK